MTMIPGLFLQGESGGALTGSLMMVVPLAIAVAFIVALWKVYVKAGQPGWAVLIPIYNLYVLLKIAGRPGWWLLLFLVPLVNIVIAVLVAIDIAKCFGKGAGFGLILLFLLGGVGYLILGFGSARYVGKAAVT